MLQKLKIFNYLTNICFASMPSNSSQHLNIFTTRILPTGTNTSKLKYTVDYYSTFWWTNELWNSGISNLTMYSLMNEVTSFSNTFLFDASNKRKQICCRSFASHCIFRRRYRSNFFKSRFLFSSYFYTKSLWSILTAHQIISNLCWLLYFIFLALEIIRRLRSERTKSLSSLDQKGSASSIHLGSREWERRRSEDKRAIWWSAGVFLYTLFIGHVRRSVLDCLSLI
jgi:hypothetical protein